MDSENESENDVVQINAEDEFLDENEMPRDEVDTEGPRDEAGEGAPRAEDQPATEEEVEDPVSARMRYELGIVHPDIHMTPDEYFYVVHDTRPGDGDYILETAQVQFQVLFFNNTNPMEEYYAEVYIPAALSNELHDAFVKAAAVSISEHVQSWYDPGASASNNSSSNIPQNSVDDKPKDDKKVDEPKVDPKEKYSTMDTNIPGKTAPTLTFSEGLCEMLVEMSKQDRRLTSAEKRQKWLKNYSLSKEQHKLISPLFTFSNSSLEEEIGKSIAPSLANALRSLIDQETHIDFPLFKIFDVLFTHSTKNVSDTRIRIESVEQAQKLVDELNVTVHDAILGRMWSIHTLKMTIVNLMAAQFKQKGQQRMVQNVIKSNLDNTPENGMMANLSSSLSKFTKTAKNLQKAGMATKRGADISLASSSLAKKPKLLTVSFSDQNKPPYAGPNNSGGSATYRGRGGYRGGAGPSRGGGRGGSGRGRGSYQRGNQRGSRGGYRGRGGRGGQGATGNKE